MIIIKKDEASLLKIGRVMYIFEALFEYLISLLVTGSYLATLTKEFNFSDSLTGILSSVVSLGCLFQIMSISFRIPKVKGFVIAMSIVNQLLFMLLYIIPLSGIGKQIKTVLFVLFIIMAYIIYNFAHPKKISWLMSLVDDKHRGGFTANKEIISLVCGMLFSFITGAVLDHFELLGKIKIAFFIAAVIIFVLLIMHTLTLIFTFEKPINKSKDNSINQSIKNILKNKNILKVTIVYIFYNIAYYVAAPFYGTYQINELGFNLKTVSLLVILGSVSRIVVSKFWGNFADKKSFALMIEKCFIVLAISYACMIAAVPSNGLIMVALYYVLNGIAMGGINNALINLIFDYSPYEIRSDALAISQAVAGMVGFLATICITPLVTHIQQSSNSIFGVSLFAQQAVSAIGLIFIIVAITYVRIVLIKNKKGGSI